MVWEWSSKNRLFYTPLQLTLFWMQFGLLQVYEVYLACKCLCLSCNSAGPCLGALVSLTSRRTTFSPLHFLRAQIELSKNLKNKKKHASFVEEVQKYRFGSFQMTDFFHFFFPTYFLFRQTVKRQVCLYKKWKWKISPKNTENTQWIYKKYSSVFFCEKVEYQPTVLSRSES